MGAPHLEVVELLRFDHGKRLGSVMGGEQVLGGAGSGVAGVVPAFPGEQGSGALERGSSEAAHVVHGADPSGPGDSGAPD